MIIAFSSAQRASIRHPLKSSTVTSRPHRIYKTQRLSLHRSLIKAEKDDVQPTEQQSEASSANDGSSPSNTQPAASTATPAKELTPGTWRALLSQSVDKLKLNFWPLVLAHLLCDIVVFILHRVSHRLTNETAVWLFAVNGISPESIGNMWWLSADPAIANFDTGYQILTIGIFILAFPLNVLLKTAASIATLLICRDDLGDSTHQLPWYNFFKGLRGAWPPLNSLKSHIMGMWKPVFVVELIVAAVVVPLQFASLAVVTLPLTLPVILDLQAAGAAAVLEGQKGMDAVKRSWSLVRPIRWQLAIPFVGLVVVQRLAEALKGWLLTAMPARFYRELVELPIAIVVFGAFLSMVLSRLQDVLPYAAYEQAIFKENEENCGSAA